MLEIKTLDQTMLVCPKCDLDMVSAKVFKETVDAYLLMNPQIKILEIDLREVGFIDSSGLGAIIGRYKNMLLRQGTLVLSHPQANIRRLLEMSGLKKLLPPMQASKEVL